MLENPLMQHFNTSFSLEKGREGHQRKREIFFICRLLLNTVWPRFRSYGQAVTHSSVRLLGCPASRDADQGPGAALCPRGTERQGGPYQAGPEDGRVPDGPSPGAAPIPGRQPRRQLSKTLIAADKYKCTGRRIPGLHCAFFF